MAESKTIQSSSPRRLDTAASRGRQKAAAYDALDTVAHATPQPKSPMVYGPTHYSTHSAKVPNGSSGDRTRNDRRQQRTSRPHEVTPETIGARERHGSVGRTRSSPYAQPSTHRGSWVRRPPADRVLPGSREGYLSPCLTSQAGARR